jgi:hypothetical protein
MPQSFSNEIDNDVEMATLLILFAREINKKDNEPNEHKGRNAVLPPDMHSADNPPPSKYVRRQKTSRAPPKGPLSIHAEMEPTIFSASGPKGECDKELEYDQRQEYQKTCLQ